jgi:hypothetical protein
LSFEGLHDPHHNPEDLNPQTTGSNEAPDSLNADQLSQAHLEKLRAAAAPEALEVARGAATDLEKALLAYTLRPGADPELLRLARELTDELSRVLYFGASDEELPPENTLTAKAALYGAARVLDVTDGSYQRGTEPSGRADLAHHFLNRTAVLVGSLEGGDAVLRMRLSPDQAGQFARHRRGAPGRPDPTVPS